MFFTNLLFFSILINNNEISYKSDQLSFSNQYQINVASNKINTNKIGIVDFRFILKRSNAMKILGNKFLLLEKNINNEVKELQIHLKKKEEALKKDKGNLSNIDYQNRLKTFKEEVFQTQKKYKDKRVVLNKSFQKIQKDLKDLLAKVIKDVSTKKNIDVVLLKENVFLFNDLSIDFTIEVLELFNIRTKSMKIIITSTD